MTVPSQTVTSASSGIYFVFAPQTLSSTGRSLLGWWISRMSSIRSRGGTNNLLLGRVRNSPSGLLCKSKTTADEPGGPPMTDPTPKSPRTPAVCQTTDPRLQALDPVRGFFCGVAAVGVNVPGTGFFLCGVGVFSWFMRGFPQPGR